MLTQRLHGGGIAQNRQGTLVLGIGGFRRNTGKVTRRLVVAKGAVEGHRHLAGRHGTGLIQHHAINRARCLQHLRITNQNAQLPAAARTRQQSRRGRQAQGARAGHHQHRHRRVERRRTVTGNQPPADQSQCRNRQNHRHEHGRNAVRQAGNRSLRLLGARHQLAHLRQGRLGAHAGRAHRQRTGRVDRSTRDRIARMHLNRHGLAGQQGRIHRGGTLDHHAVRGNLLARAHQEQVVRHEVLHRNLHLLRHALLIGAQQGCLLRAHAQQGAQRLRGTVAGAVLNRATNQQEQRHHGRRIEVQRRVVAGKHRPEAAARMVYVRRQRRVHEQLRQRVEVRHDHAEGHERIHRGGAVTGVDERGAVERCGAPERDRRGQNRHDPAPVRELKRREHGNQEDGHAQNCRVDNAVGEAALHARGAVLVTAAGCARVGGGARARAVLEVRLVAGVVDGLDDLLVAHTLGHNDARGLQGQVHRRVNAGDFAELALHAAHAGCAGHALNIHVNDSG